MSSLYADLGVPPDAPEADIRKAYRKAAKKAHPDAPGGSREKFERIGTALSVLTDARKREQYDRTGQVEEPEADNREGKAKQLALQQVCLVMAEIEKRGARIENFNVIDMTVTGLKDQLAEFGRKIVQAQKDEEKSRKVAKRFKAKKGKTNFLGLMLEARANDVVTVRLKFEQDRELCGMAIKVLQDHTFEIEPQAPRPGGYWGESPMMDMLTRHP